MKILLSWSSGKDSAWMLHVLRQDPTVEVVGLLTTVNRVHGRVAMHGVREGLLDAQADAAGLPLWKVPIPHPCSNQVYEAAMLDILSRAEEDGVEAVAFGDLFLEDVRRYREDLLRRTKLVPLFPLWGEPTWELARAMIAAGLRARIVCLDPRQLSREFVGREVDEKLLAELPAGVDPCGERGEFHTFAYAGPMFCRPIPVDRGEVVEREGFVFLDLRGAKSPSPEAPLPER